MSAQTAVALRLFMDSPFFAGIANPAALSGPDGATFLRNRLEAAFVAGWSAGASKPNEWMTIGELARRAGRTVGSVSRTIARIGGTMPGLTLQRSGHRGSARCREGRILRVSATEECIALLRGKGEA